MVISWLVILLLPAVEEKSVAWIVPLFSTMRSAAKLTEPLSVAPFIWILPRPSMVSKLPTLDSVAAAPKVTVPEFSSSAVWLPKLTTARSVPSAVPILIFCAVTLTPAPEAEAIAEIEPTSKLMVPKLTEAVWSAVLDSTRKPGKTSSLGLYLVVSMFKVPLPAKEPEPETMF